ncbi:MAG TPA: response regulator transcription factor [Actinophytocola sp.]|jgi:DNA-binding NarL/FixJ family response regulator|uniref:response regulator transcription factor n=1 Tax=Actinophytocola sp. TaxID=1872138 RepID=UPI002E03E09E|nr:response regulator transcription factor [Actinophytocola sp.]
MDQWTEANWPSRANPPVLRAVAGRSLRVLPRPDISYDPGRLPALAPDAIRVLVVSDDVLARRGVLAALDDQPGMVVVGDRGPGPGVAAAILSANPDVVLLHGLTAEEAEPTLAAVRQGGRAARVLAVGTRTDLSTIDNEICGRLPASADPEQVAAAVRMAAAGYVLHRGPAAPPPADPRDAKDFAQAAGLTDRECEVLTLVARGLSNAEIATALTVSEHTVKSHVQNLLGKLKLRNRIHAVIFAFDTGLARPGARD